MANIITIDGPTSSGKSSVALRFANNIGYQFIDSGAIYRAGTHYILIHGIPVENEERVAGVFRDLDIKFMNEDGKHKVYLGDEDISEYLHQLQVTSVVPIVSAYPSVREEAKKIQRKVGEAQNTVMTGRDIGTEIFPDAKLKIYLTASPEIRARRRYDQLKAKDATVTYEDVLSDMLKRDEMDSTRAASPLRKPEEAVVVDTTDMSTEESVDKLLEEYHKIFSD